MSLIEDRSPPDPQTYARAVALLHEHLEGPVASEPFVQTVEFDPAIPRWYVRFGCDGRDAATIYFDLHQRSLHYEVYFLPDPPQHREELLAMVLRANHQRYGAHFSVGPDGDLYLTGRVLLEHLDAVALDRTIGEIYEVTERWSSRLATIAFGKRSEGAN